MSQTLVHLAQPVVITTIDYLLADAPVYPHQQAFANPELRQTLVISVLNHLTGRCLTWDEPSDPGNWQQLVLLTAQREDLAQTIRRIMDQVLRENWSWVERYLAALSNANENEDYSYR